MAENITLIIMSAGESSRFCEKSRTKKHWLYIYGEPLWLFVANALQNRYKFQKVIITARENEANYMRRFCDYEIVCGGKSRQKSLENAIKSVESEFIAVSDVARFGLDFRVLDRLFSQDLSNIDCVIPTLGVADTIFLNDNNSKQYLDRNALNLIQTPQISRLSTLKNALKLGDFSDESSAINAFGGKIITIKGSKKLHKLTTFEDLGVIMTHCDFRDFSQNHLHNSINDIFVGFGFDTHRFCKNKQMVLCGVEIESEFGLEAHSDGDVVLHALCDALLGGIGAGDIGEWFPPDDMTFKNANSSHLLQSVFDFVESVGFCLINVDITILAEIPKITPYKNAMVSVLARILKLPKNRINIKATTMEKMGFVGRGEGICAKAIVSLKHIDLSQINFGK